MIYQRLIAKKHQILKIFSKSSIFQFYFQVIGLSSKTRTMKANGYGATAKLVVADLGIGNAIKSIAKARRYLFSAVFQSLFFLPIGLFI